MECVSSYLSHGIQLLLHTSKGVANKVVVCQNHGYTGMRLWIVGLCLVGKIVNVIQNGFDVCLQSLQCVLKVLSVVPLFGAFVVGLASHVELVGGILIILLEDAVEEDIPNFGRNVAGLSAKQQIFKVVVQFFNFPLQVHCLAKDGGCVVVEESVLGKEWSRIGWIAERNGELGSSLNVVDGSGHEISITVIGNDNIGVGSVVELSV